MQQEWVRAVARRGPRLEGFLPDSLIPVTTKSHGAGLEQGPLTPRMIGGESGGAGERGAVKGNFTSYMSHNNTHPTRMEATADRML